MQSSRGDAARSVGGVGQVRQGGAVAQLVTGGLLPESLPFRFPLQLRDVVSKRARGVGLMMVLRGNGGGMVVRGAGDPWAGSIPSTSPVSQSTNPTSTPRGRELRSSSSRGLSELSLGRTPSQPPGFCYRMLRRCDADSGCVCCGCRYRKVGRFGRQPRKPR